jgi:small subunit ribosomal protein S6e
VKVVIADPKDGKCYQVELDEMKSKPFHGLKIGDEVDGSLVGVTGYKLQITGGTDKDGFPMRKDVHGTERKRALLRGKPGFRAKKKGEKKRKTIRGNVIAEDVAQINAKVLAYGGKKISELLGVKKEEKTEEKKVEKPVEEKPKEEKPKEEEKVEEKKEEPKEKKEEVKDEEKQ